MKCEEFLEKLDADEGWNSPEAKAHAESCRNCREAAGRWVAASRSLAAMKDDEAPPFIHTRIMARVREAGERKPFWSAAGIFRAAWAGPLLVLALAFVVGGYGLKRIIEPVRKPVPQSEMATPEKIAGGPEADSGRMSAPRVELPSVGGALEQAKQKPEPAAKKEAARAKAGDERRDRASAFAEPSGAGELSKEAVAPQAPAPAPIPEKMKSFNEAASTEQQVAPSQSAAREAPVMADAFKSTAANQPALAAQAAPSRYLLVDLVECTLKSEGDKEYVILKLPPAQCPPEGQLWEVTVAKDGAVEVKDTQGQRKQSLKEMLETRVQELKILPGRYSLGRMAQ